jgi:hypothetical protein
LRGFYHVAKRLADCAARTKVQHCKGVIMTNEQMKAVEALRTALAAARTTGLTDTEIDKATATDTSYPEFKSARRPINYNPTADYLAGSKK